MLKLYLNIFLIHLIILSFSLKIQAETEFEYYLNDFYNKTSKAIQILKEIELEKKNGSRNNYCSRQREASKIGLKANESLIKAYKINRSAPPIKSIESNKKKWINIRENC